MSSATHILPSKINESFVLKKCDSMVEMGIWPKTQKVDPRRWIKNFDKKDREYAIHLLNAFLYFPQEFVDEMFVTGFQNLSKLQNIRHAGDCLSDVKMRWNEFMDSVIITHVTGENPNVTDSGYGFDRKARKLLGIDESQILSPQSAMEELLTEPSRPLVLVDDFVGTGQQFEKSWERQLILSNGSKNSFKDIASAKEGPFYYCPIICTDIGWKKINSVCNDVILSPVHTLSPEYSALHANSIIWPEELRLKGIDFIKRVSLDAGMPNTNGRDVNDWQGYHRLGLALAFEDSTPDATMSIFRWEKNGWSPLVKRA